MECNNWNNFTEIWIKIMVAFFEDENEPVDLSPDSDSDSNTSDSNIDMGLMIMPL